MKTPKLIVVIVAILCIAGLEAYALFLGHDGVLLSGTLALIVGAAVINIKRSRFGCGLFSVNNRLRRIPGHARN